MFIDYTDIIYQGSFDKPIRITFPKQEYKMSITGEGGNRHLVLFNGNKGSVDLWVDTHCAKNEAFIHTVQIDGEPGSRFVMYVLQQLNRNSYKIETWCWRYTFEGLNNLFKEIYRCMNQDLISRF